ncbi:hypothetical protein [Nannocystis sp. SCPEA4]|uniref:hypothetical protein n=1 Tax=Nannocystis sp. SCPEA4 TaxID=2996787 RepID=UPI00226EB002|nr:hypothetical protein [Nannocystis sp. SCPEA4]MCY1054771.1 hypothetical protein [Nannocystis sp. SCPEA4]
MSRTITLALAALALTAVSGCDDMVQRVAEAHSGPSALKQDAGSIEGDVEGATRAKFRARPPSGINAPPSL